jgi:hypothetical protein
MFLKGYEDPVLISSEISFPETVSLTGMLKVGILFRFQFSPGMVTESV